MHLELDMHETVAWAEEKGRKWAFTLSNAGANYCEDCCDLAKLNEINWDSVAANRWSGNGISRSVKEGKQAEFLIERSVPWRLVQRVGVHSQRVVQQVAQAMQGAAHRPMLEIKSDWYY